MIFQESSSNKLSARFFHLETWQEAIGVLIGIEGDELAFEGFRVVAPGLSRQPKSSLGSLIGRRVGVFRIEDGYRVRLMEGE